MSSGPVLMISILVAFSVQGIDAGGPCHSEPCQNGGSCTAGVHNKYTCNCVAGFTGKNCSTNIDDCARQPCENGGNCIDAVDDYTCNCAAGYTGKNCSVDIDDCADQPCQNGTCIDAVNNYTCNCAAGYTGRNCRVDIDDCADQPCQNGGTCIDAVNNYTCNCTAGYTGRNCSVAPTTKPTSNASKISILLISTLVMAMGIALSLSYNI